MNAEEGKCSMSKRVTNAAVNIISESTCHGIPRVLKTNRILIKVLWIMLTLGSLGACIFTIYGLVDNYLDYDVTTKIRVIPTVNLDLPEISICNINPFLTNESQAFIDKIVKQNGVGDPFNSTLIKQILNPTALLQKSLQIISYVIYLNAADANLSDEYRKSFGFSLDQMLISCQLSGAECESSDFVWFYNLIYGNCFKFNSGKMSNGSSVPLRGLTKPGAINGVSFELFTGFDDYYSGLKGVSGLHLFINDQNGRILPFDGFDLEKSKATNILIGKTTTKQLKWPYSDCEDDFSKYDNPIFNKINSDEKRYSRLSCFMMCFQKHVSEICGCYDSNIPIFNDVPPCINLTQIFCDFREFTLFYTKESIEKKCVPFCPLECERVTFDMTITQATYPTSLYASKLMSNPVISSKFKPEDFTVENVKKSVALVNIYYPAIEYTEIEESEKMGLFDLISGVGGVLGLFLGLSFLSFAELIEIILEWILIAFESRTTSKVTDNSNQDPNVLFNKRKYSSNT